uniref:cysteine dioxygenase n=1 Tax=Auxenochlorella protothecoides TaxID=3075 RepID=A0A1D2A7X5_AUXPR
MPNYLLSVCHTFNTLSNRLAAGLRVACPLVSQGSRGPSARSCSSKGLQAGPGIPLPPIPSASHSASSIWNRTSYRMLASPATHFRTVAQGAGDQRAGHTCGQQAMPLQLRTLQSVFDLARVTFANGRNPTEGQLQLLRRALARVQLDELGLSSDACLPIDQAMPGAAQPIRYLHIFEDGEVSLGIFCLPKGACIPLHNHPGMTVFSRALLGRVHVLSFDWAEAHTDAMAGTVEGPAAPAREARRVLDCVMGSGDDPALLQPTSGGNIHQFTAVTDCAVLDLLTPPYSLDDGRDCTYYHVEGPGSGDGTFLLREAEPPSDFVVGALGMYDWD